MMLSPFTTLSKVLFTVCLFLEGYYMFNVDIAAENGMLENAQFFILLIITVILSFKARAFFKNNINDLFSYCLFLMVVIILGAAREISFGRAIGVNLNIVYNIKVVVGTFCFLILVYSICSFFRKSNNHISRLIKLSTQRSSLWLYVAATMFLVGSVFEKGISFLPKSQMIEETLELISFLLIFYSVITLKTQNKGCCQTNSKTGTIMGGRSIFSLL